MRILDMGSGNTSKNDPNIIRQMIDTVAEIDSKRIFILKWQLFEKAGDNIPLTHNNFHYAYDYAASLGFKTTASVFDIKSLDFLIDWFPIPFIKIANRPDLYWLIGEVPRRIPVIISMKKVILCEDEYPIMYDFMCCVSNYPSIKEDYEKENLESCLSHGISDHTTNWDLFKKYRPKVYECHYKLKDSTGLDAGPFARTPEQIKEVYDLI